MVVSRSATVAPACPKAILPFLPSLVMRLGLVLFLTPWGHVLGEDALVSLGGGSWVTGSPRTLIRLLAVVSGGPPCRSGQGGVRRTCGRGCFWERFFSWIERYSRRSFHLCAHLGEFVVLGATQAVSWTHTGTYQRPRPTHWGL